jgi:hypothetical protein
MSNEIKPIIEIRNMKKAIGDARVSFKDDVNYIINIIEGMRDSLTPAIGEISYGEAFEAIRKEVNDQINRITP